MELQNQYKVKISIQNPIENTQKIFIEGQKVKEIQETEKRLLEIASVEENTQVIAYFFNE